jgi:hypothetical protein
MLRSVCVTLSAVLVAGAVASAASQGRGKTHSKPAHATVEHRADPGVSVQIVFATGDVTILRNHYAPRYRNLPPGLQKKVARGGSLPPGWQKKFESFPVAVERRLSPLPDGYRRGVIGGHAVIYNARTNVVLDVAVLF